MISYVHWMKQSDAVRNHLASKFGLPVGGGREVTNGVLVSDGRTPEQVYNAFSVKELQSYVGSQSTDVYELFEAAVEIAKAELGIQEHEKPVAKKNARSTGPSSPDDGAAAKKKTGRRGRPKKKSD